MFAAWVSNKPVEENFITNFNAANQYGLKHIDRVVAENAYPLFDLKKYYTQFIQYRLHTANRKGMDEFLRMISPQPASQIPFLKSIQKQ